ncbi:MAG: hypothetical protein ACI30R_03845, partial [Sodaliphilus sp.]
SKPPAWILRPIKGFYSLSQKNITRLFNNWCHQLLRAGKMMLLPLSNIVESTLRYDSENLSVGNLPLRSASSLKIRASSPQSSGDV